MLNYSNSKVTMELRDVLASKDENGQPFDLWDFNYPFHGDFYPAGLEGYAGDDMKKAFEQKVIDHYYFHQIGAETIARFKHNFKSRILEIMPYYVQLAKSAQMMYDLDDPFGNVDMTETYTETSSGTSSGTVSATENRTESATTTETGSNDTTETVTKTETKTGTGEKEHRFSNTPQGSISNIDNYLTEASRDNERTTESITANDSVTTENDTTQTVNTSGENSRSNSGTSSAENTSTVSHTLTRKGNQGVSTYAHDMNELRQSFLNIDMMIIADLRDLFLYVY